ncbi:MAG: hypothetical protein D6755_00120 [Anaerolineae bacterium]|nr:MAG: hypothetical protein D6755_00120 [Anaerolineae bacterium]
MRARLGGAPVQALRKEIKAVTWSDLHVRRTEHGLKTVVVFDV